VIKMSEESQEVDTGFHKERLRRRELKELDE
jgi:hypothetical protein